MGRDIAINVTREETRVAVLDNNVVTELYVDRAKNKDFVGNIYKGKVVKVLPGMQAAFVDIGLDKAAFMHVSDLSLDTEPGETLLDTDDDEKGPDMPRPRRQSSLPDRAASSRGPGADGSDLQGSNRNEGPSRDDLRLTSRTVSGVHAEC